MRRFTSSWSNTLRKLGFTKAARNSRQRRQHNFSFETLEERINFSTFLRFVGQTQTASCGPCGCACSPVTLSSNNAATIPAGNLRYNSSSDPVTILNFHLEDLAGEFNEADFSKLNVTLNGTPNVTAYYAGGGNTELYGDDELDYDAALSVRLNTSGLATGTYNWDATSNVYLSSDPDHGFGDLEYTQNDEDTGYFVHVVDRTNSAFGDGWSLPGLDELVIQDSPGRPTGVALLTSTDALIWFDGEHANSDGMHTDFAREDNPYCFSTLQKVTADDTYTLTDPDGTVHNFDSDGKLQSVVDRNGNTLNTYTYDGSGRITLVTDISGNNRKFEYNGDFLSSITDFCTTAGAATSASQVTDYNFSVVDDHVVMQMIEPDPDGVGGPLARPVTTYTYNSLGQIVSVVDARNLETTISYDSAGLVQEIVQACGGTILVKTIESQAIGASSTSGMPTLAPFVNRTDIGDVAPNAAGYETQTVYGNSTISTRGGDGFTSPATNFYGVIAQKNAAGGTAVNNYGDNGLVLSTTVSDPDGAGPLPDLYTEYSYDDDTGRIVTIYYPLVGVTEHWEYGAKGQVSSYSDKNNKTTTYELNEDNGNAESMTQNEGGPVLVTYYTYTDGTGTTSIKGLTETVTDPDGSVTHYTYYSNGLVEDIISAENSSDESIVHYEYDNRDRLQFMTDGRNNTTEYVYDNLDRLIRRIDPDPDNEGPLASPIWNYSYDAIGNQTHAIDPLGNDTEYVYDVRNRLETTIQHAVAVPPPAAEWKFNESDGTNAPDSSGHDHAATVTGNESWVAGHNGNAFEFADSTKVQASDVLHESANVSISAWAKLSDAGIIGSNLLSLGNVFSIWMDHSGGTSAGMQNGSSWEYATTNHFFEGTGWHFFAATFDDDANVLSLYVDGKLAASTTTGSSIDFANSDVTIGRDANSTYFDFTGDVDDASVYSCALTAEQISKLYGSTQHSIALWHFDEAAMGADAKDSSGNGNTLTNNNSVSYASGDLHNAASFDGTSSRNLSQSSVALAGSTSFSVWINPTTFDTSANDYHVANIMSKALWGGDLNGDFRICQVDNQIQFGVRTSLDDTIIGYTMPAANEWYHIVGTYDAATATIYLYVNGTLVNSGSRTGTFSNNGHELAIGAFPGNNANTEFHGLIDEAAIYDYALTAKQVAQMYSPGSTTQADYDCNGNLKKSIDALGHVTTYDYDSLNRLIKQTDPDPDGDGIDYESTVTEYTYDAIGERTSMVVHSASEDGPDGTATLYRYNELGYQKKQIQLAEVGLTANIYNPSGVPLYTALYHDVDIDSADGAFGDYVALPDEFKVVITGAVYIDDPADVTFYVNSSDSSTLTVDDHVVVDAFESEGTVALAHGWHTITVTFDDTTSDSENVLGVTYYPGSGVQPLSDDGGVLRRTETTLTNYDAAGRLTLKVAPTNVGQEYTYDDANRVTNVVDVTYHPLDDTYSTSNVATAYTYNGRNQVVSETNGEGDITLYQHDALGRQTAEIHTGGVAGLIGEYRDGYGNLLSRQIDESLDIDNGDLPPIFSATWTGYFQLASLATVTFWLNNSDEGELYVDDKLVVANVSDDIMTESSGAVGLAAGLHSIKIVWSDQVSGPSEIVVSSDLNGSPAVIDTDGWNTGLTTLMTYDDAGNRTSLTDPDGNTTTWAYDNLNRMTSENIVIDEEMLTRAYVYDNGSRLTSKTDRNGRVTTYEYDTLNRRTFEHWFDNAEALDDEPNRTISYVYDAASNLTEVSDPDATYGYDYDNMNRVTDVTQSITGLDAPIHFGYAYDANSRVTSVAAQIDGTDDYLNSYTYDPLSRLKSVTQSENGGNAVSAKTAGYSYNSGGQLSAISRYASTSTSNPVADSNFGYDVHGRIMSIEHVGTATSTNLNEAFGYSYDDANRLNNYTSFWDGIEKNYTYDTRSQLTAVEYTSGGLDDESYTYDDNGNRVEANTIGYVPGPYNRIASDDTYTYQYDDEGNLTQRFETNEPGQRTYYTWDNRDRLVHVSTWNDDHEILTVDYAYDAFNQHIARQADRPFDAGPSRSIFVHDRGQVVLQFDKADTSDLEATDLTHRYLWGPSVDQLLADEFISEDETLWALTDRQGSITDMVDNAGIERLHRVFDSYGNVAQLSQFNSLGNPVFFGEGALDEAFAYTGRLFDRDTGLQNNLNRWYDSSTGRWLSEDPIGFNGDSSNLYRYVGNGPVNASDPSGLLAPAPVAAPLLCTPVGLAATACVAGPVVSYKVSECTLAPLTDWVVDWWIRDREPPQKVRCRLIGSADRGNDVTCTYDCGEHGQKTITKERQPGEKALPTCDVFKDFWV